MWREPEKAQRLLPRLYDPHGRLQMAEGRLASHRRDDTPVDDLFLVHHYPQPDVAAVDQLRVVGRDDSEVLVSHDAIRGLPRREVLAVLECAGNGRGLLAERAPGNQFGLGLFGQSTWAGASLADVLAAAGFAEDAWATVVLNGADDGVTQPENSHDRFAKALPRVKALHPDTILAWELDGGDLPDAHGGPMRLVVPGWYGIWWVKWPAEIVLSDVPYERFDGFWQSRRYTYQDPTGIVLSVVGEQLPRAVLVSPSDREEVTGDQPLRILAWAGESRVTTVELTVDDGSTWSGAIRVVPGTDSSWAWSHWEAALPAGLPRGLRRVGVRATDAAGRTQDWQPQPNRLGYGNNGIHVVELDLTAPSPVTTAPPPKGRTGKDEQ